MINENTFVVILAATLLGTCSAAEAKGSLDGDDIVERVLETDSFGMSGGIARTKIIVRNKAKKKRTLVFSAVSKQHDPPLSKSLVRFTSPGDVAGMGFLQIQHSDDDDDRYLYIPELKKTRRIAGKMRGKAWMGTDISYADLDRRDLRYSRAKLVGEEKLGKYDTYVVDVVPTGEDRQYKKLKLWVNKDNFVTLKMDMYNKSGTRTKTTVTRKMKKIDGKWYVTNSVMLDHKKKRSTELITKSIEGGKDVKNSQFTVRNLEKI